MTTEPTQPIFPRQLLDWAGNRSGGVRRLFDAKSGRPGGAAVFSTNLLSRLEAWAKAVVNDPASVPRILLLVGGPGNGKTEAIEATVGWLDTALGANGKLADELRLSFFPSDGQPVPRLVRVTAKAAGSQGSLLAVSIVQDASAVANASGKQAAQLLLEELDAATSGAVTDVYLCCVNRGVLDDALIESIDTDREGSTQLLEAVTRAVSLAPGAPACWPLDGYPDVAVWPMDAESLLVPPRNGGVTPAKSILDAALYAGNWLGPGACAGGTSCPFCGSRERLAREREILSLLRILRWYEIASGKRWNFRDLFSLVSYLLAGHRTSPKDAGLDPCEWAGKLAKLDAAQKLGKPSKEGATAIFTLVSAQYQHALFHSWGEDTGPALLKELKLLKLEDNATAMGLAWFLSSRRTTYLPAMISAPLEGVAQLLDPALADPDMEVQVTRSTKLALREVDARFSRSVREGLNFIIRLKLLTPMESELLERLAALDAELSNSAVRRRRPASANNVQRTVRDFACRLVRRSIGVRTAAVCDAYVLESFQGVLEDASGDELYEAAQQVEQLLNRNQQFEVSLTTTFGQPLPPAIRQATLIVPSRSVRPRDPDDPMGRPESPICYLSVGEGPSVQSIALTYELFKAVKELERGMSVASLPRSVLALLDTTRARIAGHIVRDQRVLERAKIKIGATGMVVVQKRAGFLSRKEGAPR